MVRNDAQKHDRVTLLMQGKAAAWAMGRKSLFPIDRRELKGQSVADLIVIRDEESDDLGIKFG